jgi:hypothetical protein
MPKAFWGESPQMQVVGSTRAKSRYPRSVVRRADLAGAAGAEWAAQLRRMKIRVNRRFPIG